MNLYLLKETYIHTYTLSETYMHVADNLYHVKGADADSGLSFNFVFSETILYYNLKQDP